MAVGTGAAIAIGAGAQIIGGLIGNEAAKGGRDAANRAAQSAFDAINSLQIPDMEKQKLLLEMPQVMGQYFPEQEVASALQSSGMEGVTTDPRLAQAQMKQLESLTQLGETGMNPAIEAELNQIRRDTAAQEQSRQSGIVQNMAQRGVGGSGIELATRLASSQSSAQRQSEEADRQAAMAFQNMLQAQSQAGGLATQLRGQEFGEKSDVAKAQDEINRFNTANQQAVQQRNVSGRNEAQQRNLAEQQRVADQGVALRNQQQTQNKALLQQQFENEYRKAGGVAGQYQQQASRHSQDADAAAGQWKNIGAGVGGIVSSLGGPQVKPTAAPTTATTLPSDATDYLEALKRGTKA